MFLFPIISFAQNKDEWIENLHQCESGGRNEITILDSNNEYSFGGLQFQLSTWMSFGKLYGILPQEFTNKEGLLLIHSYSVQKAIAKEMLDDKLSYHWKNCRDKIGYNYPV